MLTQKEILKGNEAIALFMGFQKTDLGWFDNDGVLSKIEDDNTFDYLCFDSSWDWLMPVINKIRSMPIYGKYVDFSSSMVSDGGICINTKYIEVTFEAVVEFIEWYETNKTT